MHNPSNDALDFLADAELQLSRLRDGDESALHFLRLRLENSVKRCAYKKLADPDDVADVVQAVFSRIWSRRALMPRDWQAARVYVLRMAENAAIDILRAAESKKCDAEGLARIPLELAVVSSESLEVSDVKLEAALRLLAKRLFGELRERELQALRLIAPKLPREGAASMARIYSDVAPEMGLDPLYVRNQWSGVQKKLRACLGAELSPTQSRRILRLLGEECT